MVKYERPQTAAEFLHLWHPLAQARNTAGLEALERHLPEIAETNPAMALDILRDLATSDTYSAQEAAAIYARDLFHAKRPEVTDLLVTLFQTAHMQQDTYIQGKVLDTIHAITTDPKMATRAEGRKLLATVTRSGDKQTADKD